MPLFHFWYTWDQNHTRNDCVWLQRGTSSSFWTKVGSEKISDPLSCFAHPAFKGLRSQQFSNVPDNSFQRFTISASRKFLLMYFHYCCCSFCFSLLFPYLTNMERDCCRCYCFPYMKIHSSQQSLTQGCQMWMNFPLHHIAESSSCPSSSKGLIEEALLVQKCSNGHYSFDALLAFGSLKVFSLRRWFTPKKRVAFVMIITLCITGWKLSGMDIPVCVP